MNHTFRRAFRTLSSVALRPGSGGTTSCNYTVVQTCGVLDGKSRCFGEVSANFLVPQRSVSYWYRKYLYIVRARKKKEQFKYPERFEKPQPRNSYIEWNYNAEIFAFGKRVGEAFDETLLKEALTDQTYIHKERIKQEELGLDPELIQLRNNEELSKLGVGLTRRFLMEFLEKEIPLLPVEGHRAILNHLMSLETMSHIASNLGLKDLILCEDYPPSNEVLMRAMFAVIGALRNSSDEERTSKFIVDFIASLLCNEDVNDIWDIPRPWHMMVEIAKSRNLFPVEPRLIREAGKNTIHGVFVVGVYDKDKRLLGQGIGETMDIAQEMAARDVLKGFFNTRDPMPPFEFQSKNIPYKLIPHARNIYQQ